MGHFLTCVCAIVALCIPCSPVIAETYYITTTLDSCPPSHDECFNLSHCANKPNDSFASNTTIILLPGKHILDSELLIRDITYLSVTSNSSASVTCIQSGRFRFESIEQVWVSNLVFSGCVSNVIILVDQFTLEDCTLNGQEHNGTGLEMNMNGAANIVRCNFSFNTGNYVSHPIHPWMTVKGGGAIIINHTNASITNSHFEGNAADFAGAILCVNSSMEVENSTFKNNIAATHAGGVQAAASYVWLYNCTFFKNTLTETISYGGAVQIFKSTSNITNCIFKNNTAESGGAIDLFDTYDTNFMSNNEFVNNSASFGSVMIVEQAILVTSEFLNIHENQHRTIFAFDCKLTFSGNTSITNNSYTNSSKLQHSGGAIASFRSEITFIGLANLAFNNAKQGGAISAIESKLNFQGEVTISHNRASTTGGGIYAYLSNINFWGNTSIANNTAVEEGGGIHSVDTSTSLLDRGYLRFMANSATRGGGMCLDSNSKLYVIKNATECVTGNMCSVRDRNNWLKLEFTNNSAEYGGALFVSDETTSSTCNAIPFRAQSTTGECFFQGLALHPWIEDHLIVNNTYFYNNSAGMAGNTLYGGLLDRCTVSSYAEIFRVSNYTELNRNSMDAISYILNLTNIQRVDLQFELSSDPVRVCFCKNNEPDCEYKLLPIVARKGEKFNVSLVAVNQVNNTVPNTTIHVQSSISSLLGFSDEFSAKNTEESCTNFSYNIFSSNDMEEVYLYASGPCKDAEASKRSIIVKFKSCPIGFQDSKTKCECDPILFPKFITNCSIDSESVLRKQTVWISLLNATDQMGYTVYSNCPFDYCHPVTKQVSVNLNIPTGADAQCAFNRSGRLCGSCEEGLSLSLGNSHCRSCSNNGLALLIVFAIAGVALVAIILLLNLTVAIGTTNGLIFYANIVAANRAIFLPFGNYNILTVFIAWLNLDFGIETCFYDGMDGYGKTWLQFLFPFYILFLVAMVILSAHYSQHFAKLLSNRNPVAALATLVLLSYAKLIRTILAALSFATLEHHTNDSEVETAVVWLVDANLNYFQGKHIPLFIAALLLLLVGLAYTFFLLFWQLLQRCPSVECLKWIQNVKLNAFIDAYHAPYTKRHRYWTGLLLLVRVILYLVAALNFVGGPKNTLLSIACIVGGLLLLKDLAKYKVYKTWFLNALDSSFIFNLVIFATATLYVRETGGNQAVLAHISTSIAFVTFLAILVNHAFTNFTLLQKFADKISEQLNILLKNVKPKTAKMFDQQVEIQKTDDEMNKTQEEEEFSELREPILDDPTSSDCHMIEISTNKTEMSLVATHSEIEGVPTDQYPDDVDDSMATY